MTGYVLDNTVLTAFAQGDDHVANTLAALDENSIRLSVPILELATAQAGLSDDQAASIAGLVTHLPAIELDVLDGTDPARELAHAAAWITDPPDLAAAHTSAVAHRLDWAILTLDPTRWEAVNTQLPWKPRIIQLAEPPDGA